MNFSLQKNGRKKVRQGHRVIEGRVIEGFYCTYYIAPKNNYNYKRPKNGRINLRVHYTLPRLFLATVIYFNVVYTIQSLRN